MMMMEALPPLSQLIPTPRKDATCQLLLKSGVVVKKGFLYKKQSDRKKGILGSVLGTRWRHRYVVISKNCVYMFKNESATQCQRALSLFGFNEVSAYNSSKSERFKFVIKDALEDREWNRTLGFYTTSDDERRDWMDCFRNEIFTANIHLYRSLGSLSMPRSSSSPSVGGCSSPIHPAESSASLSTIMGCMPAMHRHKIQESLRKTEDGRKTDLSSSDEDDDYTEIIESDPEEIDSSPSKKVFDMRGRPPLPPPPELVSADIARQKTEPAIMKRNQSLHSKIRTFSCPSPPFIPGSCEFRLPPDRCSPRSNVPRSLGSQSELSPIPSRSSAFLPIPPKAEPRSFGSQSELGLSPIPLRSSAFLPIPPKAEPRSFGSHSELRLSPTPPRSSAFLTIPPNAQKPIPPVKPKKLVTVASLVTDQPPLAPKTMGEECPAIPPKIAPRIVNVTGNIRRKPLPPLPLSETPLADDNRAEDDASESRTSPVISSKEADDDDDDVEFRTSPLVKASYCLHDADEAQRIMLEVEEDGVFMIRKATDGQDYKTLMVRCGPKVRKYKIIREEGELYSLHLGQSGFRNVRELLEFYIDNPVPNQTIKLTKPFTDVCSLK